MYFEMKKTNVDFYDDDYFKEGENSREILYK